MFRRSEIFIARPGEIAVAPSHPHLIAIRSVKCRKRPQAQNGSFVHRRRSAGANAIFYKDLAPPEPNPGPPDPPTNPLQPTRLPTYLGPVADLEGIFYEIQH